MQFSEGSKDHYLTLVPPIMPTGLLVEIEIHVFREKAAVGITSRECVTDTPPKEFLTNKTAAAIKAPVWLEIQPLRFSFTKPGGLYVP